MTVTQVRSLLQKKVMSILLGFFLAAGSVAYAEVLDCEVGDYSKGNWEYVNPDLSSDQAQITCTLPMSGPIINHQMIAGGYMASVGVMWTYGCNGDGHCPNDNFIGTEDPSLKTNEEQCQSMYYGGFQKKYENGCCYVREHATYGDWLPYYGIYQYGYRLKRWKCNPQPTAPIMKQSNTGTPQCIPKFSQQVKVPVMKEI